METTPFWPTQRQRIVLAGLLTLLLITVLTQVIPTVQAGIMPTRSADAFVDSIGVATHLRYLDTAYSRYEAVIKPRLQELGVRHIRDGGKDTLMFQKLNDLATLGIRSTLVMDPRDGITPDNVINEVITPVLPSIEAAEGPNEWDVQPQLTYNGQPFPEGIRQYQTQLFNTIKNSPATSNIAVLMPSLAIPFFAPQLGFLEPLDFGNMHSYAGGNLPSQDLDTKWLPLTRVVAGNYKPIMATETGWHTAIADPNPSQSPVSEAVAARYLPRLFLEYFNRAIQRTFAYELIDERPAPNQENNFGLLRFDGSPKPAFTALQNLIGLLQDPGPSFQLEPLNYQLNGDLNLVHHTVLQKRDRRFYVILWQEVPSFNPPTRTDINVPPQSVTLTLQVPMQQAIAYQPLISPAALWQQSNPTTLNVQVADHPLVIELMPS
jgi:hypothetical protein